MKHRSAQPGRIFAVVAMGGCLLQVGGCVSGLAPIYLSIVESTLLSMLLETLVAS